MKIKLAITPVAAYVQDIDHLEEKWSQNYLIENVCFHQSLFQLKINIQAIKSVLCRAAECPGAW